MFEKVANVVVRATGAPLTWLLRPRDSVLETFILCLIVFACIGYAAAAFAEVKIAAARVWPAADYTRVTLESPQPIRHQMLSLKNPERLVLDLENVALNAALNGLADKIGPMIRRMWCARTVRPGMAGVRSQVSGRGA